MLLFRTKLRENQMRQEIDLKHISVSINQTIYDDVFGSCNINFDLDGRFFTGLFMLGHAYLIPILYRRIFFTLKRNNKCDVWKGIIKLIHKTPHLLSWEKSEQLNNRFRVFVYPKCLVLRIFIFITKVFMFET